MDRLVIRRYLLLLLPSLVLSAIQLIGAQAADGQILRGLVFDSDTDTPIPLATVTLISSRGEAITSVVSTEEGFFQIESDEGGALMLRAVAPGYRPARAGPFEMGDDEVRVVELRLSPQPFDLEGLLVEGTTQGSPGNRLTENGFWERYAEGRGQFLTPAEVANSDAMFTPQLLRVLEHVISQEGATPWTVWPRFREAAGSMLAEPARDRAQSLVPGYRYCEPRIYVDNAWVNRPGFGLRGNADDPDDLDDPGVGGLDDVIPLEYVEAVEVYWGPFQAPMRYQGSSAENPCGVILIWSRSAA
jgi:carboxypeptidase family protein